MIEIYTDGSTRIRNQRGVYNIGGHGWVAVEDGKIINAYATERTGTTNNKEELLGILDAFMKYGTKDLENAPIIYTDSAYALNCFTDWMYRWKDQGWQLLTGGTPLNLDIIQAFYNHEQKGYHVILKKIEGHSGHTFNELADQLAKGEISVEEVLNFKEL